jgi:hypothetical protein
MKMNLARPISYFTLMVVVTVALPSTHYNLVYSSLIRIKLIFLIFILIPNNNYRLKETRNHTYYLKAIQ